jgi:hypothetical protein
MARISELHYSNAFASSTSVSEFLEIALSAGEDPADFTVGFYQSNGTSDLSISLSDPGVQVIYDMQSDEFIYVISADFFNIRLTDPDGGGSNNYEAYALVNTTTNDVIDFYDIGGGTINILATNGIANGAISTNLATPTNANSSTYSLQFNQPNPTTLSYDALSEGDTGIVCFVSGTRISTPTGYRPVEALRAGDMVVTDDDGAQSLCWVGARTVPAVGAFAPILIKKGALGNVADILVSPQHRMVLRGWRAELMFGATEVLIAACHLINDRDIFRRPGGMVTYHHILFDRHQVVFAEDCPTESFFPGAQAMSNLDHQSRAELFQLFPELRVNAADYGPMARMTVGGSEARAFARLRKPCSLHSTPRMIADIATL